MLLDNGDSCFICSNIGEAGGSVVVDGAGDGADCCDTVLTAGEAGGLEVVVVPASCLSAAM